LPLCPPNQNCGDTLRQVAGEGSPLPLCAPDQKCNDKLLSSSAAVAGKLS
jgi:hypothetical protein